MIRDTLKVLGSNLAVNLSSFVVLAIAARSLPIASFAHLSLIVAASQMLSSGLDLGTNLGAVKKYTEARDPKYLSTLIWLKLAVSGACLLIGVLGLMVFDPVISRHPDQSGGLWVPWFTILLCAAAINLWTGARALEQARQDFSGLARASVIFAVLRTGLGLLGLATADAIVTAVAFFIGPLVAVGFAERRKIAGLVQPYDAPAAHSVVRYALPAYISSFLYNIFIYCPQFVAAHRLDAQSVGMFGLLLTFLGPLALFNMSVRLYLLPRVAGNEVSRATVLANPRSMALVAAVAVGGLCLIALGAVAAGIFYASRFPGLAWPLATFISVYFLTAMLGFFNLDVHRLGKAVLEARVNAARLAVLVVLLALFGHSLGTIIGLSVTTMLAGEIGLFILTGREGAQQSAQHRAGPDPSRNPGPDIAD